MGRGRDRDRMMAKARGSRSRDRRMGKEELQEDGEKAFINTYRQRKEQQW